MIAISCLGTWSDILCGIILRLLLTHVESIIKHNTHTLDMMNKETITWILSDVEAPVGFWDPAGFTADGNSENFARRRQTELKHGRVSM